MNIKDLINLAGEQGKVVVLGDDGEVKGVFLVYNEYQKLSAIKAGQGKKPEQVIEHINREILQAQLTESLEASTKKIETEQGSTTSPSRPFGNLLTKRAQELFADKPFGRSEEPSYDMRAEVVDPNFGRPPLQPVVESDNDEEIKPEFDDI